MDEKLCEVWKFYLSSFSIIKKGSYSNFAPSAVVNYWIPVSLATVYFYVTILSVMSHWPQAMYWGMYVIRNACTYNNWAVSDGHVFGKSSRWPSCHFVWLQSTVWFVSVSILWFNSLALSCSLPGQLVTSAQPYISCDQPGRWRGASG